jgi:intracellular multiplication protein IcmM
MSREAWRLITHSKQFYAHSLRRIESILVFSVILNVILGIGVYFVYFHQPDQQFYATTGALPPEMLTPMDEANQTSVPLLANDSENDEETKVIPQ